MPGHAGGNKGVFHWHPPAKAGGKRGMYEKPFPASSRECLVVQDKPERTVLWLNGTMTGKIPSVGPFESTGATEPGSL